MKIKQTQVKPFSKLILQHAGCYRIYNAYHNRYYVGESLDLSVRIRQHATELSKKTHLNKLMQAHYNEIVEKDLDSYEIFRANDT